MQDYPPALLMLADGTGFQGVSIGSTGCAVGEVVFNTALTGYQEILTDPSYSAQLVTMTYPHIGNTGVNEDDMESHAMFAAGLIIRSPPLRYSNWRASRSLSDALCDHRMVAIAGVDTRRLTRLLRDHGAQNGCIMTGSIDPQLALQRARQAPSMVGLPLAHTVSTVGAYSWCDALDSAPAALRYDVVAIDYGIKYNSLRMLRQRGCRVRVVPANTDADTIRMLNPDGIFLSNGPGDPAAYVAEIETVRQLLEMDIPLFGVCLGHQFLALACGARTSKLKFGHHGANHPVQDLATKKVMMTSQNHNFFVDAQTLPASLRATHISLFDGTLQGVACVDRPAFSFQGHPEGGPGPHDAYYLFDRFVDMMAHRR